MLSIEDFRKIVNQTMSALTKQNFKIDDTKKLSNNVTELKITLYESELAYRQVVIWIDIATRRCFIKRFVKQNFLESNPKIVNNDDIIININSQLVQCRQF